MSSDELINAIINQESLNEITRILDAGADVNSPNSAGLIPIIVAANTGDANIVTLLLQRGAEVNNSYAGETALHEAAKMALPEIAKILLDAGADIDAENDEEKTPLFLAIEDELENPGTEVARFELIELLLERGADVSIDNEDGILPLELAINKVELNSYKAINIVKLLLEKGADINAEDADGKSLLENAIKINNQDLNNLLIEKGFNIPKNTLTSRIIYGNIEAVKLLIEEGADVNAISEEGESPLFLALLSILEHPTEERQPYIDIFELLIKKGADVNIKTQRTNQPLLYYTINGELNKEETDKVIKLLIENGADVNVIFNDNKSTALSTILDYLINDSDDDTVLIGNDIHDRDTDELIYIAEQLLRYGADFRNIDISDPNLLVTAASGGSLLAEKLIDAGSDINKPNDFNVSPLLSAVLGNNVKIVKLLLEKGADINVEDADGRTPMYYAMEQLKNAEMVELLFNAAIKASPQINPAEILINITAGIDLYLVLMNAVINTEQDLVKFLIKNKAVSINQADDRGFTILMLAVSSNNLSIIKFLIENGADPTKVDNRGYKLIDFAKTDEMRNMINNNDYDLPLWKGYAQSDIDIFQSLFESEQLGADLAMCPVCLQTVARGAGCMYMTHICPKIYNLTLYNRFKYDSAVFGGGVIKGIISWCTICNRICKNHKHYKQTYMNSRSVPNIIQPPDDSSPFDKDCRNQGGGGIDEKKGRIQILIETVCELQLKVDKITDWEARMILIEKVWNSPLYKDIEQKIAIINKNKKFTPPENCMFNKPAATVYVPTGPPTAKELTPEEILALKPRIFNAGDPIKEGDPDVPNTCAIEGGEHDDHRPVYGLRHKNRDGVEHGDVINDLGDWGERICAQHLESLLKNTPVGTTKGKCPLTADCKAKLYPEEIEGIVSPEIHAWYKQLFRESNNMVGGGRRKTFRNKKGSRKTRHKFRGGVDIPPILGKLENETCDISPIQKQGATRHKTYRNKKSKF